MTRSTEERVEQFLRAEFRAVFQQHGRNPPALRDIAIERDYSQEQFLIRIRFDNGDVRRGIVHAGYERFAPRGSWGGRRSDRFFYDAQRLYSVTFENWLLERELSAAREHLLQVEMVNVDPDVIAQAHIQYQQQADTIRRNHNIRTYEYRDGYELTDHTIPIPPEHRARLQQQQLEYMWVLVNMGSSEVGSKEAAERGLQLLKEHLTPAQKAQYEAHKYFDVRGGASGKTYRIKHGRQMNISELNGNGEPVCGWCFLPQGNLVAGDVMLAQKNALELYEEKALKIANRFEAGCDYGGGFVTYVERYAPRFANPRGIFGSFPGS